MESQRPYRAYNYAFGARVLALRTRIALTQDEFAQQIGVHRRSVQNWETGESYPKAETLQRLLTVLLAHGAFGEDVADESVANATTVRDEAIALWQLAADDGSQALPPFDEAWFANTISTPLAPGLPQTVGQVATASLPAPSAIIDWGEITAPPPLVGRAPELATLHAWVVAERCRVVTLLGLGGIGKSSVAITFARQLSATAADAFDLILFRSLQNGPPLALVLDQAIRAISAQQTLPPDAVADKVATLVQLFRERRCLLVLDNFETVLQPGSLTGTYRAGYDDYGLLLRALAERDHQSCLLLTSREKPAELGPLEGRATPVRTLALAGLTTQACQAVLRTKEVAGSEADLDALARLYGGNPLALNLVAEPIVEIFGGDVAAFLSTDDAFFNGMSRLLDQQFARSTPLEQSILYWLAIERELLAFQDLLADVAARVAQRDLLNALESLRRRMLIERSATRPAFTLQPVILEYMTEMLQARVFDEIVDGQPDLLAHYALVKATAKEYVRSSQEQLIAMPLLERLKLRLGDAVAVDRQLVQLLDFWRGLPPQLQGYGPGNVVNLLRLHRDHLRHLDLAHLAIRQGYFRGAAMQDSKLTAATVSEALFTETFGPMTAVAISDTGANGGQLAASNRRGQLFVWHWRALAAEQTLQRVWQAHVGMIPTLAFSPDGRTLATSGGWVGSVKLWEAASGVLLWTGMHEGHVNTVAFHPEGKMLASAADDGTVRVWDVQTGTELQRIDHPAAVAGVAWHPAGHLLASGDWEGRVWLWQLRPDAVCLEHWPAHSLRVDGMAFAPDGKMLATAGWDALVKLWNTSNLDVTNLDMPTVVADPADPPASDDGRLVATLAHHKDRAVRVAWSADGKTLASSSHDPTIWLWDVETRRARLALSGHGDGVYGLAFMPDGNSLVSSSEDGTVRAWDTVNGQTLRLLRGHALALYDVDWSPDSTQVISGGTDHEVTVYSLDHTIPPRVLQGHSGIVLSVGWSRDGQLLASSEWDNVIRVWDAADGTTRHLLQHPNHATNYFAALAWSPAGQLACATYQHGVLVWDAHTQAQRWFDHARPTWIRTLTWHPDGARLAGADEQGTIFVWDAATGARLMQMGQPHHAVLSLAWQPAPVANTHWLAAAGFGKDGGELLMWDIAHSEPRQVVDGQAAIFCAVAWGATAQTLVSGDSDGRLCWWDVERGECVCAQQAHQGIVQALRRSPDGTKLASCGDDGAVMIWDLQTGDHLRTLRRDRPYERMDITGIIGLTDAQRASLIVLGAVDRSPL